MTHERWSPYNTVLLPKPRDVKLAVTAYLAVNGKPPAREAIKLPQVRELDLDEISNPADFALWRIFAATRTVLEHIVAGRFACVTEDNNVAIVPTRWWRPLETRRRQATRQTLVPLLRYDICAEFVPVTARYSITFRLPQQFMTAVTDTLELNGYTPYTLSDTELRIHIT